jgi:tyrosine-protein phosphatase YwqE
MFNLFPAKKEKDKNRVYSLLGTDMHSHLIPGVDDGSPDLATSLQLIRGMYELGYKKIITTPHVMRDMYKNSPETILPKLDLLREALIHEGLGVEIQAAAEYFLDEDVEELLRNNKKLLTISGNLVLTEFSLAWHQHNIKEILFEMQMRGYQPVIAHPERYIYLQNNKAFYDELKDIGCLFQLNILSLGGHYGKSVQELAQHLIKMNYYDLAGTDLHHARHLKALQAHTITHTLQKMLERGKLKNPGL